MALFLVQHGKSLPKEADPDQGLSEQGVSEAIRIAGVAQGYGVKVAKILHSGKTRARQTAQIMAEHLTPGKQPVEKGGLSPMDDIAIFARTLSPENDLMIVGHLPFLTRLVSYLITGSADTEVFRFQNAGIVCMDRDPGADTWVIKWTLMPEIR
jgi:phosphohistidine phosphatase